ncbi:isochorismatase family protein [Streptomyces nodosus]
MTSSRVSPYLMTAVASPPAGGPSWSIDPKRSALLVQHMQKHLVHALRDRAPVAELLANIARLTRSARTAGVPVVYAVRVPPQRAGAPGGGRPVLLGPAPEVRVDAVVDVVQPQVGDTVLTAKRSSSFAGTQLPFTLRRLGRDQLVVVGTTAGTEVLRTAADAWTRDIESFVVSDAVVDRTSQDHATALRWLAATCASVVATDSVLEAFRGPHSAAGTP